MAQHIRIVNCGGIKPDRGGDVVSIVHRARVRGMARHERQNVGKSVFSDADKWIGAVRDGGAVFDSDGVRIGVEWPGGEIVDFHGVRIGHL